MENDERFQKLANRLKWAIGIGGAIMLGPFAFIAIKGVVGLIIALAIGGAAIQLAPAFSFKLANLRMKMITNEASANPIETMQTLFQEKSEELNDADGKIEDFETEIRNFDDQIDTFKKQYPPEATAYVELSKKMNEALAEMKSEQRSARKELQNFDAQITKAKAIYKMSLAAQHVAELSSSAESQVFAKIKSDVAFDSVRSQLNRSFAALNLSLERRKEANPELMLNSNSTQRRIA